jgi:predicted MFS family arabinose efflux permease
VLSPLQSPRLRRIVAAYTVNRLGTWFGFVALSVAVFDHTHSALAVAALLLCGQVLPAFAVPAVVARVEASPRRGELSALYLFEGIATTALAVLLLWHFTLVAILLLVALDGTAALAASALLRTAAARAARESADGPSDEGPRAVEALPVAGLPAHTYAGQSGAIGKLTGGGDTTDRSPSDAREASEHEAERKANAALNIAFSATFMLGPALAGLVVAAAGGSTALFIDAASFLICGAMLTDLRPHVEEGEGASSVRARLRAAWQHINDVPALRSLLLVEALALVFFEFSGPIEVAYAKATLHAGDRGYGLLLAVWGVGVVVGSVVFARSVRRPLGAMLSAGTLAVGLAYIGFAVAPSLLVACLAALFGGVGNGVQWASLISAVQRLTPQRLQGRLMGAVESIGAVCPAVGLSLGGALVVLSSPRVAFLVAGLGATATTAAFLRLSLHDATPAMAADDTNATVAGRAPHAQESPPRDQGGLGEPAAIGD